MTTVPETRYARAVDGVHIAYQVIGDGPVDLVWVMGWASNIEVMWEEPNLARFLSSLATFSRLILFDKRGVGLSDRVPDAQLPTMETRMDDVRAVMEAAGSERAVVFGVSEGGPMAMLFAATYPERTIALILFGTDPDYTSMQTDDPFVAADDEYLDYIDRHWGTVEHARKEIAWWGAPSRADDERLASWLASYLRRAASPGAAIALSRMNRQIDVSHALPAIHVPTLVLAKSGDVGFPIEGMRETTARIAGARLVELPGDEHFFWVADHEPMIDEIERFVGEFRDQEADLERFLATVMFTDIVGSTERAAALGDRGWRISSRPITPASEVSWHGSRASRSTPPAMASSRPSTAPGGRSAARRRSSPPSGSSGSRSAPGCIPARSSGWVTTSAGSPSTSAPGSGRRPAPPRCSCRRRSRTSSRALT